MTPPMTNDLIERLRAAYTKTDARFGEFEGDHINPDGPEAAAHIEALAERVRELEGALEPFAAVGKAIDVNDFGEALFDNMATAFEATWRDARQALSASPAPAGDLVERVARTIAEGLGDNFDHAFVSKPEWIAARGEKGGRYRDVNEPMQPDYMDAARAVIAAMQPGWRDGQITEIVDLLENLAGADEITEATYVNFNGITRDWRDALNEAACMLQPLPAPPGVGG